MKLKLLILFFASIIPCLAIDLRVVKHNDNSYIIDYEKIVAIEPYYKWTFKGDGTVVYSLEGEIFIGDYIKSVAGTRIHLQRSDSSVQVANGGAGLISGGAAKNEGGATVILIPDVSVEEVFRQLKNQ